jgi:cellulose biosynthesis protein BcsQ
MAVPAVNFTIDRGVDFLTAIRIKIDGAPIELTEYSFSSKIKKHYGSSTSYNITITPTAPTDEGLVDLSISAEDSADIPVGRYYYDLLATNNATGFVTKVVEGTILVKGTAS